MTALLLLAMRSTLLTALSHDRIAAISNAVNITDRMTALLLLTVLSTLLTTLSMTAMRSTLLTA